jgi:hypothetical protein
MKHPRFKNVRNKSAADEFGRLAQGIGGRIKGTDTIRFIHKHEIPADRLKDLTYIKFVCTVRTEKKEPHRTRATMGGNLINHQLSQCWHPNSQLVAHKDVSQQCHFNERGQVCQCRSCQLLPYDTIETTQMRQD